jgi:hypothetical protein
VDGKVTQIGALYTVKVNTVTSDGVALVGGFGIYNDGSTVQAGFDVDEFWVGNTQANKRKPFIISGGVTYIDEAAIEKLTFSKLRDTSGSFIVENGKVKADYLNVTQINGGTYTGYAWPTSGTGFHLGPLGFLLGRYSASDPSSGYFQYDVMAKALYTNGMSIVNGVLTISQANVINTLNIANESVVVAEQFNFLKMGSSGNNTGYYEDTFQFYMSHAGYVHVTAVSMFFSNSPPADYSKSVFSIGNLMFSGRVGEGVLSATPKIAIARLYLAAGWHTGRVAHEYYNIEVNDILNMTDVIILKAYR